MQQWEYLLEVVHNDFLNREGRYRMSNQDQLNRLGEQGWELVQITKVPNEGFKDKFSLVFKRLK